MTEKKRDYKHEYKTYQGKPEQIANRSERNKARRVVEKDVGNLRSNQDVDHKKMLKDGGDNKRSNLRVVDEKKNTAWRKGVKGYG